MAEVAQTFINDPYAAQQNSLARQQKLAEILQSQAFQPDQKFSYGGFEAAPSAAGALAKGLQGAVAGYLQGRSLKGQDDLVKKASEDTASSNEALIRGLSAKPWTDPDTGKMSGTGGGYAGALSALGDMKDNPQAQRLAQALTVKKLEQDMAQTKLGAGEAVFNSSGQKLFGQDPAAKFGTTPQNIARDQNSPTGWSGMIVNGANGETKMVPVQPPRDMTDLTMNQQVEAGQRGATIGQSGQKLNYETGMTPAMPPSVQGAGVPAPQMPGVPPQARPGAVVPTPAVPDAPQRPTTVSQENPLIKNVPPQEAQKLLTDQPNAKQAVLTIDATIGQNVEQIDNLLKQKGFNSIFGTIASKTPNISEAAGNAQAAFDAVRGQAAVQALNQMRAASKTGGAVGTVTEKEWPILESQMAALAQAQSPAQMRLALKDLKATYERIQTTSKKAYADVYGEQVNSGSAIDDLLAKYGRK